MFITKNIYWCVLFGLSIIRVHLPSKQAVRFSPCWKKKGLPPSLAVEVKAAMDDKIRTPGKRTLMCRKRKASVCISIS